MTLEQLRIFVAVADRLHFTRAAEALGLTQSAVSAAIAALEGRYGVTLFHRVGRHVELSDAGSAFLIEAREVLTTATHAEAIFQDLAGLKRGRLVIMGSQTIATYWLPPRLFAFRQAYPGIAIELSIGNTAQVAAAVVAGTVEVGFVEGTVDQAVLESTPIDEDRLVLVGGQNHGWIGDQAMERADFQRLSWVLREPGSGTRAATEALLATRGLAVADVAVTLELPSNEAVRAAVEAGAGASVLSLMVATTGLRAGVLTAAACAMPTRRFCRLRHRERRLSGAARAFCASLGKRPWPVGSP
jgi:DNA-binding transcriptional LysR family regulator